jgi:hypothetical protein
MFCFYSPDLPDTSIVCLLIVSIPSQCFRFSRVRPPTLFSRFCISRGTKPTKKNIACSSPFALTLFILFPRPRLYPATGPNMMPTILKTRHTLNNRKRSRQSRSGGGSFFSLQKPLQYPAKFNSAIIASDVKTPSYCIIPGGSNLRSDWEFDFYDRLERYKTPAPFT